MGGIREQIERFEMVEVVARVDHPAQIARQRRDVARHIDEPRRARPQHAIERLLRHAGAGRVDDQRG